MKIGIDDAKWIVNKVNNRAICYACEHGNFPRFKNTNAHR